MRNWGVVLVLASVAGCAGQTAMAPGVDINLARAEAQRQQELVLEDYQASYLRGYNVFTRIAKANASVCDRSATAYVGMVMTTVSIYPRDMQAAARRVLSAGDGVTVSTIAAGGPADRAGIKVGDRVVGVSGQAIGTGVSARDFAGRLIRGRAVRTEPRS